MKTFLIITIIATLFACDNTRQTQETTVEPVVSNNEKPVEKPAKASINVSDNALATLDLGYTFRLHELVRYHPNEQMVKMFKFDDAKSDFYIIDASIQNNTADVKDAGADMLAVYFNLSNGETTRSSLKGASILAAYNTENKPRYPKEQYDLLWSSKFPSNSSARSHLFAAEVPKGVTITGIGFHEKKAAKNKYADL